MATVSGALRLSASTFLLVLAACSNGRGSVEQGGSEAQPPSSTQFTVAASVAGLQGSGLVLQNNGGDDVVVTTNGAVLFPTRLDEGAQFNVTVLTQPSDPAQNCIVDNGAGTIAGANITNVTVTCETPAVEPSSFRIGGTVQGLEGAGLVLQNNEGDDVTIDGVGEFTFATPLATGSAYSVAVRSMPTDPTQTCTVTNGVGEVGTADVTSVVVTCSTNTFSLGGRVQGLLGTGLQIQNSGGASLEITEDGTFMFPERLAAGSPYSISVTTPPSAPPQSCAIENATGTIAESDVTDVLITCSTNQYTIGGTITGLAGSGLRLTAAGAGSYEATTNGAFQFPTALASGTSYTVDVVTDPIDPKQTCVVANESGVIATENVTNVAVTCTTDRFTVGGRVSGLAGEGLVLQRNGEDDLAVASNGAFTFETAQDSGTSYEVSVAAQPTSPPQICTVERGTGTIGRNNVTNVRVSCATETYAVGGSVTGLLGTGLVLRNNGADPVEIESDGGFTFPREIASGATYNVTVATQPTNPVQSCSIENAIGTVGGVDIANVSVNCTTSRFSLGGSVSGLAGAGLVIANGTEQLAVNANGRFDFPTALSSGTSYNVTIVTQPSSPTQTCTVSNGAGVVADINISNIAIACVTTEFTVGGTVSGLSGSGLTLVNNGADSIPIASNGPFTFPGSLVAGSTYNITVAGQPQNPSQTCAVSEGVGTVSGNVTNVSVQCTTMTFTVGGSVTGLTGGVGTLVLQNGGDSITLAVDGAFTFGSAIASGGTYDVTVGSDPINRDCTVANAQGTVTNAPIADVNVMCRPVPIGPFPGQL